MPRIQFLLAAALAPTLWLAGYTAGHRETSPTPPSTLCTAQEPTPAAVASDTSRLRRLEAACRNEAPPLEDIPGQLARTSCRLDAPAPLAEPLPTEERVRRLDESVVVVGTLYHCGKCQNLHFSQATGFAVGRGGAVATSYHVLGEQDVKSAAVMDHRGRTFPVRGVLAAREEDDLLILDTAATDLAPLPLSGEASPGEEVLVLSHPSGSLYSLTSGIVSRLYRQNRRGDRPPWLTITAPFARGSSGAPVLDRKGNVVGVVSQTRALFAENDGEANNYPQMILNNCSPARGLLDLAAQAE
jgi:S1-C subfamily serine protease